MAKYGQSKEGVQAVVRDGISDEVTFEQKPIGNEKHHLNTCAKTAKAEKNLKNQMLLPTQLGGVGLNLLTYP